MKKPIAPVLTPEERQAMAEYYMDPGGADCHTEMAEHKLRDALQELVYLVEWSAKNPDDEDAVRLMKALEAALAHRLPFLP